MSGEAAIDTIIHAAPTDWIWPPMFETRLAIQTDRNVVNVSGEKAETVLPSVVDSVPVVTHAALHQPGRPHCRGAA